MSEEQNIQNKDSEEGKSENETVDEPAPEAAASTGSHQPAAVSSPFPEDTDQPKTINEKPEISAMEVHKHPHHVTHKKKLGEYFLEFLMIFLAVTLGFFAENLREKISEHKNAASLAASLYSDLARDTASLNRIAESRYYKMRVLDSFFLLLQAKPQKIEAREFFHFILPAFSWSNFSSTQSTGTLTQLKNAGYLRYYTHTNIPSAIVAYESSVSALSDMEKTEQQQISDKGFSFLNEEIDPALYNIGYSDIEIPASSYVVPRHTDSFRSLYGNCVSIGILNRNIAQQFVQDAKQKAVDLMIVLKKEYHLE